MSEFEFLSVIPLMTLRGLSLGVTATRVLERWSDVVEGVAPLASLSPLDRIDVMDECLDVVALRPDLPTGFEFTGLSVAEFRATLAAAPGYALARTVCDAQLRSPALDALREAGRQRTQRLSGDTALRQLRLWLPESVGKGETIPTPEALRALEDAAESPYRHKERNRLAVELSTVGSCSDADFPVRGTDYQAPEFEHLFYFIVWDENRLLPQPCVQDPDYREHQLLLPSVEGSYFSPHFPARNVFAHWRLSGFTNADGERVAVLDEIQSDWMHDLRWQRLGKLPQLRWVSGDGKTGTLPATVPSCPLAESWLQVAVDALVDYCRQCDMDILAWVPGSIQHELNPALPLPAAQRLYDVRFPKYLQRRLGRKVPEFLVDYPTYSRDALLDRETNQRFTLWTPDHEIQIGPPLPNREVAMQVYREKVRPVMQALPAIMLWDFG